MSAMAEKEVGASAAFATVAEAHVAAASAPMAAAPLSKVQPCQSFCTGIRCWCCPGMQRAHAGFENFGKQALYWFRYCACTFLQLF